MGISQSLRRHDWAHRWAAILDTVGWEWVFITLAPGPSGAAATRAARFSAVCAGVVHAAAVNAAATFPPTSKAAVAAG